MKLLIPVPAELRGNPALAAAHRQVITAARAFERVSENGLNTAPAAAQEYELARAALARAVAATLKPAAGKVVAAPVTLGVFERLTDADRIVVLDHLAGAA